MVRCVLRAYSHRQGTAAHVCEGRSPVRGRLAPDGKVLAVAGQDGSVRLVLAPSTGKELRVLRGHRGRVTCLAFSPDGKLLATGGQDRIVILWNPLNGKETRRRTPGRIRPLRRWHSLRVARCCCRRAERRGCGCGRFPRAERLANWRGTREAGWRWPSLRWASWQYPAAASHSRVCGRFTAARSGATSAATPAGSARRLVGRRPTVGQCPRGRHRPPVGGFLGQGVAAPRRTRGAVTALAFAADGRTLISAGRHDGPGLGRAGRGAWGTGETAGVDRGRP